MNIAVARELIALLTPRERRQAAWLVFFALIGAFAEALGIGAVFPFMGLLNNPSIVLHDARIRALFDWSGVATVDRFIVCAALVLLLIFLIKNMLLALLYFFQARFVCKVEARLGTDLLTVYLRAPYVARLERNSTDRLRIITGEVGRVTAGFLMPAISIVIESLAITAMITLLLIVHPLAALLALVLVGTVGLATHTVFRRWLTRYRDVRVTAVEAMFKWVNEGIGAIKETKVLAREDHFIREFAAHAGAYARATEVFNSLNITPRLILETTAVGALLLAVILSVARGEPMPDIVPVLTLFGLAALRIMPSANRIMTASNNLRYYESSVHEVANELRLVERYIKRIPHDAAPPRARKRAPLTQLEFRDITFRYPASADPNLSHLSLNIERGRMIALVGRSGSGKTTFADVLLGLLDPDEGTILVNGREIKSLRGEWQGMSGLVPQEFFLLDDTVRRNVAFGMPDREIDEERVWTALRLAQLEARVRQMPDLLDTRIGERGATLSGGERQRLSIARALYDDPDILVLDEATSALDTTTEAELMETLTSLAGSKTLIVIAHRLTTVARCDRVCLMQAGQIVDTGTFNELAARNSDFGQMVHSDTSAKAG